MGMRINGVQDSFVVVSYDFEYTTEVSTIKLNANKIDFLLKPWCTSKIPVVNV